jgi:hypothetical protein
VALLVDNVVQFVGDLLVHAPEVVPIEPVLALLAQPFQHLAQTLNTVALAVTHTVLHQSAQGRVHVTVVEQIVGELVEQTVGVDVEALLRAVPARVGEPTWHRRNLSDHPFSEVPKSRVSSRCLSVEGFLPAGGEETLDSRHSGRKPSTSGLCERLHERPAIR